MRKLRRTLYCFFEAQFAARTPLTDDRRPWLRGSEEHPWTARRNTSGKGVVSAILVRALLSALGSVEIKESYCRAAKRRQLEWVIRHEGIFPTFRVAR